MSTWLGSLSGPPPYVVLEAGVAFEERYEAEAFWTLLLRQRGEKLLNLSVGAQISPEHAAKATAAGRRALAAKRQRQRDLHHAGEVTP
ncbi:hypothetical protein [Streptomyces gilvus]|uniref:hypothetical protein n=1 Tax=Streptomyces gilvus TaxID=2920937 RepID=UPI001F111FE3|nr:hypothetical protein [Streptomyces sp. CME 23]MCH5677919.1 hypothetical protein [Streptomyces sp. CME 23]